jgi:chemotaxis protein methyltransferase CheR
MSTRSELDTIEVSPPSVTLVRDLVHETTGLYYADVRTAQLVERLAPLVLERGFPSLLDYYYLLKYDTAAAPEEWRRVFDALSVPETYFWREIDQLRALVSVVVPRCVAALDGRPLRIWSIPCASGEEPLTLAMLLDEAGWFGRAPIAIEASDASPAAIARAQAGLYRGRSFRNIPPEVRERYFSREDDAWRVSPELHKRVSWSVVNLMDPAEAAPRAAAPIVICRNLFIYFSERSIRQAVAMFAARMPRPGYLAVGVSESLLKVTNDFDLQDIGGAFMYVKR